MILNDEEVEDRISSPKNLLNIIGRKEQESLTKVLPMANSGGYHPTIPDKVRELIAGFRGNGEPLKDIAAEFEMSPNTVSAIGRGLGNKGTFNPTLAEMGRKNNGKIDVAHELALDCLMESLTALNPRLNDPNLKTRELSQIAKDMSGIVGSIRPEEKGNVNNTQVVIFAPQQKKMNDYEFIEA